MILFQWKQSFGGTKEVIATPGSALRSNSGNHTRWWELNMGWPHVRELPYPHLSMPCPQYYCSSPQISSFHGVWRVWRLSKISVAFKVAFIIASSIIAFSTINIHTIITLSFWLLPESAWPVHNSRCKLFFKTKVVISTIRTSQKQNSYFWSYLSHCYFNHFSFSHHIQTLF